MYCPSAGAGGPIGTTIAGSTRTQPSAVLISMLVSLPCEVASPTLRRALRWQHLNPYLLPIYYCGVVANGHVTLALCRTLDISSRTEVLDLLIYLYPHVITLTHSMQPLPIAMACHHHRTYPALATRYACDDHAHTGHSS